VLANVTSLEVQMIELVQELQDTREELVLKGALAAKSVELEQRLKRSATSTSGSLQRLPTSSASRSSTHK